MTQNVRLSVLNVGGNDRNIALPSLYEGWRQVWLDIDPDVNPDILCDARELTQQKADDFDAVYCSHNLEHYYRHDVPKVLAGFRHVLKPDGFAHIRVPDLASVMRATLDRKLDLEDELYHSAAGPISVLDVIYGYGKEIESSGNDFFAHKTGFTPGSLHLALQAAGFAHIYCTLGHFEINAVAFMDAPNDRQCEAFGIKRDT